MKKINVIWPATPTFTVNDVAQTNSISKISAHLALTKAVGKGQFQVVGKQPRQGKGRKALLYSVATQNTTNNVAS